MISPLTQTTLQTRSEYTPKGLQAPKDSISQNLKPFAPILQLLYASFLKILILARKGLSRGNAIPHILQYLKWMDEELDFLSVYPLQAALAIFGGDSRARKLVGVDDSRKDPRKLAWGAASDTFLVLMNHTGTMGKVYKHWQNCIFVTNDNALFSVFCRNVPNSAIFAGEIVPICSHEIDFNYPHFNNTPIQK